MQIGKFYAVKKQKKSKKDKNSSKTCVSLFFGSSRFAVGPFASTLVVVLVWIPRSRAPLPSVTYATTVPNSWINIPHCVKISRKTVSILLTFFGTYLFLCFTLPFR